MWFTSNICKYVVQNIVHTTMMLENITYATSKISFICIMDLACSVLNVYLRPSLLFFIITAEHTFLKLGNNYNIYSIKFNFKVVIFWCLHRPVLLIYYMYRLTLSKINSYSSIIIIKHKYLYKILFSFFLRLLMRFYIMLYNDALH